MIERICDQLVITTNLHNENLTLKMKLTIIAILLVKRF
jgi:hypothetical protein